MMGAPEIGQIAPDFTRSDSTGGSRHLSTMVSRLPVVLIFYRGHW